MVVTIDVETTGLNPLWDRLLTVSWCVDGRTPVNSFVLGSGPLPAQLVDALSTSGVVIRGHNAKFDTQFLARNGFTIAEDAVIDDTRVQAYCAYPHADLGLKSLTEAFFGERPTHMADFAIKPKKKADKARMAEDPKYIKSFDGFYELDKLLEYNREDVTNTNRISSFIPKTQWYLQTERPLTRMLYDSEMRGIQLDIPYLIDLQQEFAGEVNKYSAEARALSGKQDLNPGSPKQLQEVFGARYDLSKYTGKTKTGYSCDAAFLKRLCWLHQDPLAAAIRKHREYQKLLSTYIEPFLRLSDVQGSIHGFFNQAGKEEEGGASGGTKTGRLSSSDPNLQNISTRTKTGRRIRQAFIAHEGHQMFVRDVKQFEPRFVAHFSQAPKLLDAYKKGLDTHGMFAADIFGKKIEELTKMERFIGKTSWLATVYGCSPQKLLTIAERNSDDWLEIEGLDKLFILWDKADGKAKKKLIAESMNEEVARDTYCKWKFFEQVQQTFWEKNPEIKAWRAEHIARTRRDGYVTTYGGRRIPIVGLNGNKWEVLEAERKTVNYVIQGSQADAMKLIMLEFRRQLEEKRKAFMLAVVHDEILGEIPLHEDGTRIDQMVNEIICNTTKLNNVPLESDGGLILNWAEK